MKFGYTKQFTINNPHIAMAIEAADRASDAIVRSLEARIISGELADRSPLPAERELMVEFTASRTVVREAIANLSNRGFVENRPRFRPRVRKPGIDSILDTLSGVTSHLLGEDAGIRNLYSTRIFVERMLVRDAATNARKDDIKSLRKALADNKLAIDNPDDFYRTDLEFHSVLYDITRNPIFPSLHIAFKTWLHPHWANMPRSPERNYVNFRGHEDILTGIVERDPDAAEKSLDSHLSAAWENVRAVLA